MPLSLQVMELAGNSKTTKRRTERLGVDGKKTALKVMPPISLCWSTTSEADGGAVAIEVELS